MRAIRALKGQEEDQPETREDMLAKGRLAAAARAAARGRSSFSRAEEEDPRHEGSQRSLRFGDANAFAEEETRLNEMYAKPEVVMGGVL